MPLYHIVTGVVKRKSPFTVEMHHYTAYHLNFRQFCTKVKKLFVYAQLNSDPPLAAKTPSVCNVKTFPNKVIDKSMYIFSPDFAFHIGFLKIALQH